MPAALLFASPTFLALAVLIALHPRDALDALTEPAVLVAAVLLALPLILRS